MAARFAFLFAVTLFMTYKLATTSMTVRTWSAVYVPKVLLEKKSTNAQDISITSNFACAALATQNPSIHLYCYDRGLCLLRELLQEPLLSSTGLDEPIKCMTRHSNTEEPPCLVISPNMDPRYGCFFYFSQPTTWGEAKSFCRSLGMNLLSNMQIETLRQREILRDYLKVTGNNWVGASRTAEETSKYTWITGDDLPRSDPRWNPGEPTMSVVELAVHLYDVVLFDDEPENKFPFICAQGHPPTA